MITHPQLIHSQEELDSLIEGNGNDPFNCFVLLNHGLRSSKEISFNDNGDYFIYNDCDGSEETIPHDCLMSSFIGEAIDSKALFAY